MSNLNIIQHEHPLSFNRVFQFTLALDYFSRCIPMLIFLVYIIKYYTILAGCWYILEYWTYSSSHFPLSFLVTNVTKNHHSNGFSVFIFFLQVVQPQNMATMVSAVLWSMIILYRTPCKVFMYSVHFYWWCNDDISFFSVFT